MKRLEELGISPSPWTVSGTRQEPYLYGVEDAKGLNVAQFNCIQSRLDQMIANTYLTADAPELYDCLVDAIGCLERCSDAKIYEGRVARYKRVVAKATRKQTEDD